jgi:prepilin-type N-terminal cleavage/methylation domain-containing protein
MKRGGYRQSTGGFTIVEVLIVLAVSSLILLSAMTLVNGRQARTEFTTGVNDLEQQFQQIINETASGYYPNTQDFTCTGNPGSAVSFTLIPRGQGTNASCIFLGKAIQFGTTASGVDPTRLTVLPLAGNGYQNATHDPILTLAQAGPRAIYPANALDRAPIDAITAETMEYGLQVASSNAQCAIPGNPPICYWTGSTYAKTGIAAFVAGDSGGNIAANNPAGGLASGTQQVSLYAVSPSQPGDSLGAATAHIGNISGASGLGGLVSTSKILICIASATTSQAGLFTISGDGSLSVTLAIKGAGCA